jgi:hypothetical protein
MGVLYIVQLNPIVPAPTLSNSSNPTKATRPKRYLLLVANLRAAPFPSPCCAAPLQDSFPLCSIGCFVEFLCAPAGADDERATSCLVLPYLVHSLRPADSAP